MRNNPAALMGLASKVVRTVIVKDLTESSPQSGEMFIACDGRLSFRAYGTFLSRFARGITFEAKHRLPIDLLNRGP